MAFNCLRCFISFSSLFIILGCAGIGYLAYWGIRIDDRQYYNQFFIYGLTMIATIFCFVSAIIGLGSCCTKSRACHVILVGFLFVAIVSTAGVAVVFYFFPQKLIFDPDLWQRAWSTLNKQDIETVIDVENKMICCGFDSRTDWDTARCAAYLNPDFIKKWLDGGVPYCKNAIIDHNRDYVMYTIIGSAIMAVFVIFVSFCSCGVACTKEEQDYVPLLKSEETPMQYTEKHNL